MQNKKIRLFKPSIGNEELSNIKKIFKTAWLGYGDKVNEFENKFSKFIGRKYAVGVNSGTAALHLALLSQDFKKGKKEGVVDFYYENGQLRKRQNHIKGKITGIQEQYFEDGQLEFKGTFKDNIEHGPYWNYFQDGQLFSKGSMKEGKYEGLRETYTRGGKLELKECFKNDETVDMSFCA